MTYVVELTLSELGKKVCGTDTKVYYVNDPEIQDREEITNDYIEDHLFPVISTKLVSWVRTYKSFLDCEPGEYLKAKKGDKEFLVRFEQVGWTKNTFLARRVDESQEMIEFNANGVERTHCKTKTVLSRCTLEEFTRIKKLRIKKPLIDALEIIVNNIPGVTFDKDQIELPEWMDECRAQIFYNVIDEYFS